MRRLSTGSGVVIILALLCGFASSGRSAPTEETFTVPTTSALADLCADTSPSDPMMTAAQNFCHGYMVGAYHVLLQVNAARRKPAFCVPTPPPTRSQAIAAFVQWVRANPGQAGQPPADGVFAFLMQRFPCPAKP
jgi:hypothetical protein